MRFGQGAVGRYTIPKLIVFLWRLQSFQVQGGTPVQVSACPGQYTFDPTGRNIPLFLLPLAPEADDYADTWVSAPEWDVPGPLTSSLLRAIGGYPGEQPAQAPYPVASTVAATGTAAPASLPTFYAASAGSPPEPLSIEVWPEAGVFEVTQSPPIAPEGVDYQYGFPATIGAGPYDRTLLGDPPAAVAPVQLVGGGAGLDVALQASGGAGTVRIADSATYVAVSDVGSTAAPIGQLLIQAGGDVRPVVRLPGQLGSSPPDGSPPGGSPPDDVPFEWVFTGGAGDSELTIDGLLVSGGDIVLRGAFQSVRLTAVTADPGTLTADGSAFAESVDGRVLAPVRIWIEADAGMQASSPPDSPPGPPRHAAGFAAGRERRGGIVQLTVDHCVLGPIRTRNRGRRRDAHGERQHHPGGGAGARASHARCERCL